MNYEFESARLLFRKFKASDLFDYFEFASQEQVAKYMTWDAHKSIEESKKVLDSWILDYQNKNNFLKFAIVLKEINKVIGYIHAPRFDSEGTPEIGYCLSSDFWNRGFMSEALEAMIAHLFMLGYKKININADIENVASIKVIEKCGFRFLRSDFRISKGEKTKVNYYTLTLNDYIDDLSKNEKIN